MAEGAAVAAVVVVVAMAALAVAVEMAVEMAGLPKITIASSMMVIPLLLALDHLILFATTLVMAT